MSSPSGRYATIADVPADDAGADGSWAWREGHKQGEAAARAGELRSTTPYVLGTPAGAAWYCGHCSVSDRKGWKPGPRLQQVLFA